MSGENPRNRGDFGLLVFLFFLILCDGSDFHDFFCVLKDLQTAQF